MAFQDKKFLDAEGITHLVKLLDEYPNNQVLGSVIDAIEGELEQKAEKSEIPEVPVQDVQVNGTSVLQNGIANVPVASASSLGVVRVNDSFGIGMIGGILMVNPARLDHIKSGDNGNKPIVSKHQHESTFYGLAKAAGHDEKDSTEPLGTYTPEAKGAIQKMLGITDIIATEENNLIASKAYAIGDIFVANGKLYKATAAIAQDAAIILPGSVGENCEEVTVTDGFPHDVQVNGTSIVQNGVANVPMAGNGVFGVVKIGSASNGVEIDSAGYIKPVSVSDLDAKAGTNNRKPVTSAFQHYSTFYGLAKAAGDTTQSSSANAVGTYTDNAKASIKAMLGIQDGSTGTVNVSGSTPTITAVENTRYVCGEVTSLNFTPTASGICIVRFTSGSTVTVLTIPSTVKFPEWFNPTSLETNTIYEICVTDGEFGAVMSWAL